MDSVAVTVPLRQPTKKMKKRKELDALAPPHAVSRRTSGKRSSQVWVYLKTIIIWNYVDIRCFLRMTIWQ